jgi:cytochrome c553
MNIVVTLTLICAALFGSAVAAAADPTPEAAHSAARLAATTCSACHGAAGRSTSPTFPNLAGQTPAYLSLQLHAFRDQTRADPDAQAYMWGMAAQLNDDTIQAIASYYAAQAPAAGKAANPKLLAPGKQIFEEGLASQGVPACATCHGPEGHGNAIFPRLAGQHTDYLVKQMLVIQNALRAAPVMHGVIKDLTQVQMREVALYLESLGAGTAPDHPAS